MCLFTYDVSVQLRRNATQRGSSRQQGVHRVHEQQRRESAAKRKGQGEAREGRELLHLHLHWTLPSWDEGCCQCTLNVHITVLRMMIYHIWASSTCEVDEENKVGS